jgi:hypothetical protein
MSGLFMPAEDGWEAERERFHRLANAREDPAALAWAKEWLAERLAACDADSATPLPAPEQSLDTAARPATANAELLAYHAPLGLLEGAWLQSAALAANGHRPEVAALFAAYLALLGEDEAESPAFAYRGWLSRQGAALAPATAWRFAQTPGVGGPALRFASAQLALGLHGADFFLEALGYTLAYAHSASPWRAPALPEPRRHAALDAVARHALAARRVLGEDADWARVRRGHALYRHGEAAYLAALERFAEQGISLAERVADIFRRKRRFAQGYHPTIALGGRGLEDWFADTPFNAEGFLAAFAASPYAAGESGRRPFPKLAAFGGPMFGVFTPTETALIEAWLDEGAPAPRHPLEAPPAESPRPGPCEPSPPSRPAPLDPRHLFHRLLNRDGRPETLAAAKRQADKTLARARRSLNGRNPPTFRFFDYSPPAFARHIERIHKAEVAQYRPPQTPPRLRREEYAWGLRQFAPAILVDGCWLQYLGEAASQDSRPHRLLQRIYAEELGEGRADWNHPKIYRDLLDSLGIELPATDSEDFACDRQFLDAAFDLPVHLLALSQFPRTFFPEILGLNLAIELSGLGAGYLRLADALRHWRIDPLIVELHQSIDNLAGGHAAMAAEAIELYLDELHILGGEEARQAGWRRVWTGYLSLPAATRRFRRALVLEFCRRFLPGRLWSRIWPY